MSTRMIKELWQGDRFPYGGIDWAVISQEEKGGRVISVDAVGEMKPFDDGETKDWRACSLKSYMTDTVLKQIIDGGALEDAIIEADVDLKAVDNAEDYGKDPCKIAPITQSQYKELKNAIPKISETYWLVTPFSCEELYVGGAYLHHVRIIRPDGSLDSSAPDGGAYGVRPSLILAPETEVELLSSELDEQITKILEYANPIITTEGVQELADGLKGLIRKAAAECEHIPAVQEGKEAEAETYGSYTAVTMYQAIRTAQVSGTTARTDMAVLEDKL